MARIASKLSGNSGARGLLDWRCKKYNLDRRDGTPAEHLQGQTDVQIMRQAQRCGRLCHYPVQLPLLQGSHEQEGWRVGIVW